MRLQTDRKFPGKSISDIPGDGSQSFQHWTFRLRMHRQNLPQQIRIRRRPFRIDHLERSQPSLGRRFDHHLFGHLAAE